MTLDAQRSYTICQSDDLDEKQIDQLNKHMIDLPKANLLANVFKALSDPTRLRIISLLVENEVCVHTLETMLGISQSAISHQLRHLRQLKLVRFRKEGRHVYYALDDDHVRDLIQQGLSHIEHG